MKIGIIGTGVMGSGIAQTFAESEGFDIFLCGRSAASAEKAVTNIEAKLNKRVSERKILKIEVENLIGRIHTGDWKSAYGCDLIIECIPEEFDLKVNLLKELIRNGPMAHIATNTSSLSLHDLQDAVGYPMIGMHFFNPAYIMKLVEIVYTDKNSDNEMSWIKNIALKLDKTPILVKDNPGFIVNRILITMINEAVLQYESGVASIEDIDTAMKLGANHPMGPLELADYIGLDVVLAIMNSIWEQTGDDKYKPAKTLIEMVSDNKLGRKSGIGFYFY